MKLSFVIPVYNAERYVSRCLSSLEPLLAQGHEAVIVDDGSSDDTPDILRMFMVNHPTVQVVTQTNQGQSVARNIGVSHATGDYVWFVDADDYLEDPMPELLLQTLENDDADVVVIGRTEEYDNRSVAVPSLVFSRFNSGTEYFKQANYNGWYRTQPWDKIVRRTLLLQQGISFEPGRMFEDMFHGLQIMVNARKTVQLAVYPYHYVLYNTNSLTHQYRQVDADALTAVEEATAFLDNGSFALRSSDLSYQILVYTFLSSCLLKKYIPLSFHNAEAREMVERTMRHTLFKDAVRCCAQHPSIGLKRWGMALCIWLSPRLSRYVIKWLM